MLMLYALSNLLFCVLHVHVACGIKKDVVYVIDRSGSISQQSFNKAVEFIYNVTEYLTIGTEGIQVCVVTYATDKKLEFTLNAYTTNTSVLQAINNLKGTLTGGSTNTAGALGYVLSTVLTASNGARSDVEVAVIVLTDGQSNSDPTTAAGSLRLYGAEVFSIGVGASSLVELKGIANDPASYYVMYLSSYVYLCNLVPALVPKLDSSLTAKLLKECKPDPVTTTPWPTRSTTTTTTAATTTPATKTIAAAATTTTAAAATTTKTAASTLSIAEQNDTPNTATIVGAIVAVAIFMIFAAIVLVKILIWKCMSKKLMVVRISFVPGHPTQQEIKRHGHKY